MKEILDRADVAGLRELLAREPDQAHDHIVWGPNGKNVVPPLHYVCDVVFKGRTDQATAREIGALFLEAGVDPNLDYAKSGDTFLIAAASLGAEDLGLLLMDVGADIHARGLFGAGALHWSANGGLAKLVERLLAEGADLHRPDDEYGATPLGWALHSWLEGQGSKLARIVDVIRLFRERGAEIPDWGQKGLERLEGPEHEAVREALGIA